MKTVTVEEMRSLDQAAITAGTPSTVLMERAGRGIAMAIHERFCTFSDHGRIRMLAGRGNNGGDVFCAARHLKTLGWCPEVWLAAMATDLKGDAMDHHLAMRQVGVPLLELPNPDDWDNTVERELPVSIWVDGLLGTGSKGAPRGTTARAVRMIQYASRQSWIVAIDLPTGLDGDKGLPHAPCVTADLTITLGSPKAGMLSPQGQSYCGELAVVDIGLSGQLKKVDLEVISPSEFHHRHIPYNAHKGILGQALVLAGAPGYSGAATLAIKAALRSGAGLVSGLIPAGAASIVDINCSEAMIHSYTPDNQEEFLSQHLKKATSVLAGPGMTNSQPTCEVVEALLRKATCPLVLDADALNVLSGELIKLKTCPAPVIITPHPAELARLLNCTTEDIQNNRIKAAQEAAEISGAVVILKGAGTLIAANEKSTTMNMTGNPGMATGGSGDVLAGLLCGLLAQQIQPHEAACMATYLHGRAGNRAARRYGRSALMASDLIEMLPKVQQLVRGK